ncbi:MAG: flavodoxin family protein [Christensenellales bacterium]
MKNILVLTGSPRKNGNSIKMADAFVKGAHTAGHQTARFDTAFKEIGGCRACRSCWKTGSPCPFADSFSELAPLLEAADVLVFATPIYWFGFPAKMKAAIDKMNAYLSESCPRPLKIRESLLLVCGADEGMDIFGGIIATYRLMASYMNWQDRGVLAVQNVKQTGDIEHTGALLQAEELGRSL